jgi:hypothetical protein
MVSPHLLEVYRSTLFVIEAPDRDMTLLVGEDNLAVGELLESYGVRTCALVTAWNPHSKKLEAYDNQRRQNELVEKVNKLGHPVLPGRGVGKDPTWPPEQSILIIGIRRDDAIQLGRAFEQLAIIFKQIDQVTELVPGFYPAKQVPVSPGDGIRVISIADFAVPTSRLAIYIDGASFHVGEDLRRDRFIRLRLRQGNPPWTVEELRTADLGLGGTLVERLKVLAQAP